MGYITFFVHTFVLFVTIIPQIFIQAVTAKSFIW